MSTMYFERQRGRNCIIHAWNNARGKRELSRTALMKVVDEWLKSYKERERKALRANLVGPQGISPNVLEYWVNNICREKLYMSRGSVFRDVVDLRDLWRERKPQFLLLSLRLADYRHMVSMRKSSRRGGAKPDSTEFDVLDSELPEPFPIVDELSFRVYFGVRALVAVFVVDATPPIVPSEEMEVIDLVDSERSSGSESSSSSGTEDED